MHAWHAFYQLGSIRRPLIRSFFVHSFIHSLSFLSFETEFHCVALLGLDFSLYERSRGGWPEVMELCLAARVLELKAHSTMPSLSLFL